MGLFADDIDTEIASQVYNLAGDQKDKRDPLQQAVVSSIVTGNKDLAGTIQRTIVNGSGRRLQRYYRWSRDQYSDFTPAAKVGGALEISDETVQLGLDQELGTGPEFVNRVIAAEISQTDTRTFAGDWIIRNRPDLTTEDWSSDYDAMFDVIQIDIKGEEQVKLPAPADYKWVRAETGRRLLEIIYERVERDTEAGETSEANQKLFTYRLGSGNAHFDSLIQADEDGPSGFYPMLPLRIHNSFLPDMEHDYWPEIWEPARQGYKRLTGAKLSDLIAQMEDNDSIGDVDHVFLVNGVPLNTDNQGGLEYIYRFFQELIGYQKTTPQQFYDWVAETYEDTADQIRWERWTEVVTKKKAHEFGWQKFVDGKPDDTPRPSYGQHTRTWLNFENELTDTSHFELSWITIDESNGVGNAARFDGNQERDLVPVGHYWIATDSKIELDRDDRRDDARQGHVYFTQWRRNAPPRSVNRIHVFHQYARHRYRRLTVLGMRHENYVYKNDEIRTDADDAVNSEDISPFLVPLHNPTLNKMSARRIEELSTSASHLVFNSYERVRTKWYQQDWFKFVLTVAAVAVAVAPLAGGGLGAAAGLFGSNAAVGAALGASAATAAIVGAAVNTAGAFLLSAIIQEASVHLLGEKWGRIIGAVVSVMAVQMGRSFVDSGTFWAEWGSMMNIDNLMRMTDAVGGAYQDWLAYDTQQIMEEAAELTDEYEDTMDEIQSMTEEILGSTPAAIDPMILTDASEHFGESPDTFLARTRMTGTDFAQLTHAMIENFADLTLDLPKATP